MSKQQQVVKVNIPEENTMPRTRITLAEITEVKRTFIKENLCLTLEEAGGILGVSPRTLLGWIKAGKHELEAVDESAAKTGKASSGIRVTAASVERCRLARLVPKDKWAE